MPTPEKNSVVVGGNPVIRGTRKVAPNIATTCCSPSPIVAGQASRSSGLTISPSVIVRPSPCSFQVSAMGAASGTSYGDGNSARRGCRSRFDPSPATR